MMLTGIMIHKQNHFPSEEDVAKGTQEKKKGEDRERQKMYRPKSNETMKKNMHCKHNELHPNAINVMLFLSRTSKAVWSKGFENIASKVLTSKLR